MTRSNTLRSNASLALALSASLLAVAAASPASAQAKLVAGTLTCKGEGGVAWIVGSKETLDCNFNPAGSGPHARYTGTITKVGLDVGIKGQRTLIWTVLSTTTEFAQDALNGTYDGISADAAVGIGVGANALVGGSSKGIVLQPLSVQGETGLNLAIGVSSLTLRGG